MPLITGLHLKKDQSIDSKIMQKARNSPEQMIQYFESLPDDIFEHDDPGNLINFLYQTALQSRTRTQLL
jgi:hypothetical protein